MATPRQNPVTDPKLATVERRIARTLTLLNKAGPVGTPEGLLAKARSIARLRAAQTRRRRPTRRR